MEVVSVRAENAAAIAAECPFVYLVRLLGNHWRPTVLYRIASGVATYNALKNELTPITDKMLATDLRALIEHELIVRHQFSSSPRRSHYELTRRRLSLIPLLHVVQAWADDDKRATGVPPAQA